MPNADNLNNEEPIITPEANTDNGITPPHQHYYSDMIDKFVVDRYSSDPSGTEGMMIYGTTNDKFRGYDGSAWKDIPWNSQLSAYTQELAYPSTTLQLSDDTEETNDNANYTKVKELTATVAGKIKTMFDLKKQGSVDANTIAGKIYINGSAQGAEHTTTTAVYSTFTDTNLDVVTGDLIQLYTKSVDSAEEQMCRNFRAYWDVSTKEYVDNGDTNAPVIAVATPAASANTRNSNDTEKSSASAAWAKLKEIALGDALAACRVYFEAKNGNTDDSFVRLYKNGVATGTSRTIHFNTYSGISEDFAFSSGDLVQLYIANNGGETVYVKNMRLQYDAPYQLSGVGTYYLATPLDTTTYWVASATNQDP